MLAVLLAMLCPATLEAQNALLETGPESTAARQPASSGWTIEVAQGRTTASRLQLAGTPASARLTLDLSRQVAVAAHTLGNPDRVIIDLPAIDFRLDPALGQKGEGIVEGFRFGLFGPQQSRIVIDTAGPVRIARAEVVAAHGRAGAQLVVELVRLEHPGPVDGADAVRRPGPAQLPDPGEEAGPPPARTKSRPVIVIDPGHGGIDPGTVATGSLLEKNVVLAVARHLRAALAASGRYTVVMTRASDLYISLDERLRISRKSGADLFISIHADAVPEENLAQSVRGASIYTLSEHASDEQARRLAERENGADIMAGLESTPADDRDEVRSILIDLLKRETADFSAQLRSVLAGELRKHIALARESQRAAAFKVLKQTHSPSVLVELGYMSNADDQKMLRSADWQRRVAGAMAAAIDTYFATRTAGAAVHKP